MKSVVIQTSSTARGLDAGRNHRSGTARAYERLGSSPGSSAPRLADAAEGLSAQALKRVAVIVTLSDRPDFTSDERISLNHVVHFLGQYDKYLMAPRSMAVKLPGFSVARFPDRFFGSAARHTKLLLSERFYRAFEAYEYILIYHLDSLVFSDRLIEWCDTGLDYIGAPWLACQDTPFVTQPRVGNGGFSLRRVSSFLKVIRSRRHWLDPDEYWRGVKARTSVLSRPLYWPGRLAKHLRCFNSARWQMSRWHRNAAHEANEDWFWADWGVHYYPGFRVASVEQGLRFAFEASPRTCYELNHGELPFGCHAWPKYGRDFWEPYLLK